MITPRLKLKLFGIAMLGLAPVFCLGQTQAGVTGQCNDGSLTTVPTKQGACSGHKGVKKWFGASGPGASATSGKSSAAPKNSQTVTAAPSSTPDKAAGSASTSGSSSKRSRMANSGTATSGSTSTDATGMSAGSSSPSTSTTTSSNAGSAKASAGKTAAKPAPGGGPGLVWVNTATKVYHCPGAADYGTTKAGKYMSESDATAMGARPNRGKTCPK